MLPTETIAEILGRAAVEGGLSELFLERRRCSTIVWDGGAVRERHTWEEAGAGLRVIRQGREVQRDHTEDPSPEGLKALADRICSSLGPKGSRRPAVELGEPQEEPVVVRAYPHEIDLAEKAELVQAIGQAILRRWPGIDHALVKYDDYTQEVLIANSEGLFRRDIRPMVFIMAVALVPDGAEVRLGGALLGGALDLAVVPQGEWAALGREAAERALRQRGAVSPPEGELPVVFGPRSGFIHEFLGHPLEARHADGIFAGKLGERVASPLVTLVDDATLFGLGGSYAFDDEGTPAQRTSLVENGVLRTFICDRLGAAQLGLEPTGNGRRASFRFPVLARMSNLVMAGGDATREEIIAGVERGLLVETTLGNRSNAYGGPVLLNVVEGYLIEKGKVAAPLKPFVLAGKPLEVLPNISQVGNDVAPATGMCGLPESGYIFIGDGQPTIRVEKGLRIAGTFDLGGMLPTFLQGAGGR